MRVLTANPGSSSFKLAVVDDGVQVGQTVFGRWDGEVTDLVRHALRQWPDIGAVAVPFVHGGDRPAAVVLDREMLDGLAGLSQLAPLHPICRAAVMSSGTVSEP